MPYSGILSLRANNGVSAMSVYGINIVVNKQICTFELSTILAGLIMTGFKNVQKIFDEKNLKKNDWKKI